MGLLSFFFLELSPVAFFLFVLQKKLNVSLLIKWIGDKINLSRKNSLSLSQMKFSLFTFQQLFLVLFLSGKCHQLKCHSEKMWWHQNEKGIFFWNIIKRVESLWVNDRWKQIIHILANVRLLFVSKFRQTFDLKRSWN